MTEQNTPAYADNGSVEDVDPLNTLSDPEPDEGEDLDEGDLDDPAEDPAEGKEGVTSFDELGGERAQREGPQ
jgi:hypothetical protein